VNAATKRRAPIDVEPADDGNVIFTHEPGNGSDPEYRVLTKAERAAPITAPRHTSHFTTCPNAKQHRKATR
jgi:hypothetical protein